VQKEISPQINEATIRLLNRHGVEVVVPKKIRCCGSLNHHLGKEDDAHQDFINNINTWYDEHQKGNLDAILSNTSGCGTTMKDYGFIFKDDEKMKKKAKVISDLTKDVTEYLNENLKLNFKSKDKKYKIAYHSACSMQHGQKVHNQPMNYFQKQIMKLWKFQKDIYVVDQQALIIFYKTEIAKELLRKKVKNIESLNQILFQLEILVVLLKLLMEPKLQFYIPLRY
jgi:glycolate oxidase iron-sulfur subunit